jgi:arylsulfatase A-like enzyme
MFRRFLDSPWPYFIGAVILLILAIASQFEVRVPSRDRGTVDDIAMLRGRDDLNVVFIMVDTLRADRLGVYGYERETSSVIDDLASHGILFKRVMAQSSWTKTSMASLWTGTYPANNAISRFNHSLPDEATLPAEIFKEAGFRTAGVWRNGWVAPNFGFGQGFEVYLRPKPGRERVQMERRNPSRHKLTGTDEDLVTSAMAFLENFGRERFFLYLHFMDVHQYTYDKDAAVFGTSYSDAYDQSIKWTDRLIGVLVQKIDDLDLLTETVIVIGSDHGEAFREHGSEGHAKNLHREVTEVPFAIALPFILDPGIVVEAPVANADMWPTILDLVGLPPLPNADGVSQLPMVMASGGAASPPPVDGLVRPIFARLDRRWGNPQFEPEPILGVADGDLRLFVRTKDPKDGVSLFDHSEDPGETRDISADRPEEVERLHALLIEHEESAKSPWGAGPQEVELDAMKLEQLRALGYVIK